MFEPAAPGADPTFEESGKATRSPNLVLINVSPIEYGHVLLCPRVLDCLPQNLDPSTARLALHFALEVGSPYLRVGFNSLGAFATINHLHFQVSEGFGGGCFQWRGGLLLTTNNPLHSQVGGGIGVCFGRRGGLGQGQCGWLGGCFLKPVRGGCPSFWDGS